jgi:hypothetical protein
MQNKLLYSEPFALYVLLLQYICKKYLKILLHYFHQYNLLFMYVLC